MKNATLLLLHWFEDNGRDFPFRWQTDPFKILVAGVLLRQTQATQVASVFPALIERYSSPYQLAEANEQELIALMKPLGLLSRAGALIRVAKALIQQHEGVVPSSYEALIKLPSVGDYIASCVLALGYQQPAPMVDVNVIRVLGRVYGAHQDTHKLYANICPREAADAFHYAILDLGQLVCKHSNPKCALCPIAQGCRTFNDATQRTIRA